MEAVDQGAQKPLSRKWGIMPSDFGDESGEKLFDWILKVGQDASEAALLTSAERLKGAFRNARGEIGRTAGGEDGEKVAEWAKLRMSQFEVLPEYETIKEAIDSKLSSQRIDHDFFTDQSGHDFLLFRVEDAPDVSGAFEDLEKQTDLALDKALEARSKTREQARDAESLDDRAASARQASKALDEARSPERDIELSEMRSK